MKQREDEFSIVFPSSCILFLMMMGGGGVARRQQIVMAMEMLSALTTDLKAN